MIQKRKNTKTKKILLAVLLGVIALGAIGYGTYQVLNEDTPIVETDNGGVSETISSRGVKVKLLSTRTLEDERVEKTFSYSIEPSNATNKDIKVTSAYVDGSESSQVITTSVNSENQTITITCNGPFKQKIIVKVVSVDNPDAYAEITLNYTKKIESIEGHVTSLYVGNGWEYTYEENLIDTKVTYSDFIKPTYSDFTKDQTYTFEMKDIDVFVDEFLTPHRLTDETANLVFDGFEELLIDAFENQGALPTTEDVWNLVDNDEYRSWLLKMANTDPMADHYLCFGVEGTIYCVEDPSISVQLGGGSYFYVYISFQDDYSNFKIGVDSISVETNEIDF